MTTKTLPVLSFAKLEQGMPMPHVLDIQTRAFASLLQPDGKGAERTDVGLERVFKDVFPIQDVNGNYSLEFVKYGLGEPKYSVEECIERDMTYSVPLKATLQLVVMEEVGETVKTKRPKNIIEKEVYLGELPILTPLGTFVINGAVRVIVSQLHRSPGVVFEESIHPNGQRLFSARIIPFRGSWVEFTIDIHDVIFVHIDKKKKFPASALLRAFGYGTNADILKLFYATKDIDITGKLEGRAQKREVLGTLLAVDVPDPENKKGEPLGRVGEELTLEKFNTFRRAGISKVKVFAGYTSLDLRDEAQPTSTRERQGAYILAFDVADPETGEVLVEGGRELLDTLKKKLLKAGVTKVDVLLPAGRSESPLINNTLLKDPTHTEAEALEQIYALLRPGEAPNLEVRRLARPEQRVDLLQRFGLRVRRVLEQRVVDERGLAPPRRQQHVHLGDAGLQELLLERVQQLAPALDQHLPRLRVGHVEGQDVRALPLAGRRRLRLVAQVQRGVAREHLHLADAGPAEGVELLERQLVAHLPERLALLVLGIGHVGREQRPQDFALLRPALELAGDVDVLGRVEQLQDVGVGAVPEGPEQRRRRELFLLVDVDVDHVVDVDRELDPRAAERNDARREQALPVGVDALFEHHAGRAVQLRHDHPLGAVDHERAQRREDRQLTEIDFLLDDVLGPLGLDGLAHLFHDHQLQRRLQRHRIGHVPLDAFLDRVLRLPEPVLHELEGVVPVHVLDREHVLEHPLQPDVGALGALPVRLQKRLERARLDVQEVRHRHPLVEFCERQHR